jgi:hypothetical protein
MKKFILCCLVAVSLEVSAAELMSSVVEYTISGTGSGSLNGTPFSNRSFTFNLIGDAMNYSPNGFGGHQISPLNSAAFSVTGFDSGLFAIATTIGVNDTSSWIYFSNASANRDLISLNLGTPVDITGSISAIQSVYATAIANQFVNIATTQGAFSLDSLSTQLVFSSKAVPEPSTYALLGLGLGGILLAVRRKRLC